MVMRRSGKAGGCGGGGERERGRDWGRWGEAEMVRWARRGVSVVADSECAGLASRAGRPGHGGDVGGHAAPGSQKFVFWKNCH
ncbi:hypothetical protein NL676_014162 [Syzygium grande]|nr:hypothetical protein NL676_014162 [Syzygium grande]